MFNVRGLRLTGRSFFAHRAEGRGNRHVFLRNMLEISEFVGLCACVRGTLFFCRGVWHTLRHVLFLYVRVCVFEVVSKNQTATPLSGRIWAVRIVGLQTDEAEPGSKDMPEQITDRKIHYSEFCFYAEEMCASIYLWLCQRFP